MNPLKEQNTKKKLIDPQQITKIFSDIEIIYNFNKQLLEDFLEKRLAEWNPKNVTIRRPLFKDCKYTIIFLNSNFFFLKTSDSPNLLLIRWIFLKIYNGYIQNYDSAVETLNSCVKKKTSISKIL